MQHKNITVSGRVQGVGFRYSALRAAASLGIKGFVRNLGNGGVYLEAEGGEKELDAFLRWCAEGPPLARVDSLSVTDGEIRHFTTFEVR